VQLAQAAGYTAFRAGITYQRAIRIAPDFDPFGCGGLNHIEKARVHHRLSEALQMQFFQPGELTKECGVSLERHERGTAVRRCVDPLVDRTHHAGEIALADRLDLDESRKRGSGV
jgi:hypothetical protein